VTEIARIFKGLCGRFNAANVRTERSYYFSLGEDEKWTVDVRKDGCQIREGQNGDADVFFKAPAKLFLDVWNGVHQLGPKDFLTGKVKSNSPLVLKDFAAAFGKTEEPV
jgi:hypothetical protein